MKLNRRARVRTVRGAAADPQAWPRVRIRLDVGPACAVGPGKVALLEAVERLGSLSVAARDLGMSYRRAWVLLDELNRSFDEPMAITAVGGRRGGGASITPRGLELVREYRALERAVARLATRRLRRFRERAA